MNSKLDAELLTGYISSLGRSIVEKMFTLYQQQSAIYLIDIGDALKQSSEQASQQLWQEHCHKMKGAAGSVGLITLHAMLVDLEKSTVSREEKQQLINALIQENDYSINAFSDWLATQ